MTRTPSSSVSRTLVMGMSTSAPTRAVFVWAGTASPGSNPDTQRWRFTSSSVTVLDRNKFTISNAAFPSKVLQPAGGSTNSGVPVVLGDPTGAGIHTSNAWEVTSPLLPSGGGVISA